MKDTFQIKIFEDIVPEIKAIRDEVFIKEQRIPEEIEYNEDEALYTHFCFYHNNKPFACTRMMSGKDNVVKIKSIAILKEYRGKGHSRKLIEYVEDVAKKRGNKRAEVNAPAESKVFFESLGYKREGQDFMFCDKPYIKMLKRL